MFRVKKTEVMFCCEILRFKVLLGFKVEGLGFGFEA